MRVVSEIVSVVELVVTQPTDAVMKCNVLVDCRCGLELLVAPRTGMYHALLTQLSAVKKSC